MEPITVVKLKAVEATPKNFKEFGQVVEASPDTKEFGPHDAQLDLSQGTPRSPSHPMLSIIYCIYFKVKRTLYILSKTRKAPEGRNS